MVGRRGLHGRACCGGVQLGVQLVANARDPCFFVVFIRYTSEKYARVYFVLVSIITEHCPFIYFRFCVYIFLILYRIVVATSGTIALAHGLSAS